MLFYLKREVETGHSFFICTGFSKRSSLIHPFYHLGWFFYRSGCSHPFFQGFHRTDNFWQQLLIKTLINTATSLSLVVTPCHSLSFVTTRCTTRYHSLSVVVTRRTTRLSFYKRSIYRKDFHKMEYFHEVEGIVKVLKEVKSSKTVNIN